MAYSMPDKNSAIDAGKTGATQGAPLAIGETLGRGVLGRGIGTAVGGIAVASAQSGQTRDTMALVAVERGVNEMMTAGASSGGSSRGRM